MSWSEQVYPHGELTQLDERLWLATGSLPRSVVPRNMLVYRYAPEELLVISAVALDEEKMRRLEQLGQPRVLLVPNPFHRLQAGAYLERYPQARVVCPREARAKVEELVTVHGVAEEVLPELGVTCHAPPGVKATELIYELPLSQGAALWFTDLIFNLQHQSGCSGWLVRLVGSSGSFGVTRIGRLLVVQDKAALATWLREQGAREELRLLAMGHGDLVRQDCGERLRLAADRLAPA